MIGKKEALITIWDYMMRGARSYLESQNYRAVVGLPLVGSTTLACENLHTLFSLDFYGERAFLAQSLQLPLESVTQSHGKVYCEIQSFRQEPNADNRRLAQFTLLELEILSDLDGLLLEIENTVKSAARAIALNCPQELSIFGVSPNDLLNLGFARLTYTEAIDILRQDGFDVKWGDDLDAKEEKHIADKLSSPVFLTHFPEFIKFWNMKGNNENPLVVNSSDLIMPLSGESCGASERETDHDLLIEKLEKSSMFKTLLAQGMKRESFNWYIDSHLGGEIKQHSGCGIGMARVLQSLLKQSDIREVTPFIVNRDNLL